MKDTIITIIGAAMVVAGYKSILQGKYLAGFILFLAAFAVNGAIIIRHFARRK
jgi:hypothetical protein